MNAANNVKDLRRFSSFFLIIMNMDMHKDSYGVLDKTDALKVQLEIGHVTL